VTFYEAIQRSRPRFSRAQEEERLLQQYVHIYILNKLTYNVL